MRCSQGRRWRGEKFAARISGDGCAILHGHLARMSAWLVPNEHLHWSFRKFQRASDAGAAAVFQEQVSSGGRLCTHPETCRRDVLTKQARSMPHATTFAPSCTYRLNPATANSSRFVQRAPPAKEREHAALAVNAGELGRAAACNSDNAVAEDRPEMATHPALRDGHVTDDRVHIVAGDLVLLIVEDDPHYERIALGLARDTGFKDVVAMKGLHALALTGQFLPAAISLDIFLPDMPGWTVLNQLTLDPATRQIPVQIVTMEKERQHGLAHGAFAYLVKEPTTTGLEAAFEHIKHFMLPRKKRFLVMEDNVIERASTMEMLRHNDIETVGVSSGGQALAAMPVRGLPLRGARPKVSRHEPRRRRHWHRQRPPRHRADETYPHLRMVLMDIMKPDMDGYATMREIRGLPQFSRLPILALTANAMKGDREKCLAAGASDDIAKPVNTDQLLSLMRVCLFR